MSIPNCFYWRIITSIVVLMVFVVAKEDRTTNDISHQKNNLRQLPTAQIVGGTNVPEGKYKSFAYNGDKCGGTLIHPNFILTAAFCKGTWENRIAYIGGIYSNGTKSEAIRMGKEFPHPDYAGATGNQDNNIMLVKTQCASRGQLQLLNKVIIKPQTGSTAYAVGFGRQTDNTGQSKALTEVEVNVVGPSRCAVKMSEFFEVDYLRMICAGAPDGGRDACRGDGGGPLYSRDGTQVGIISHGAGCGIAQFPGLYTRVSFYRGWIDEIIKANEDPIPTYCG